MLSAEARTEMGWMAPAPGIEVPKCGFHQRTTSGEAPSVMKLSTVGLDLAENVFQVHAIDEAGEVIVGHGAAPAAGAAILRAACALPDRHGGLRHEPLLGAGDRGTGP